MELHSKVWIEAEGAVLLSAWRVALLEAVETTGSLAVAARQLAVPYRTAWRKLKALETGYCLFTRRNRFCNRAARS